MGSYNALIGNSAAGQGDHLDRVHSQKVLKVIRGEAGLVEPRPSGGQ